MSVHINYHICSFPCVKNVCVPQRWLHLRSRWTWPSYRWSRGTTAPITCWNSWSASGTTGPTSWPVSTRDMTGTTVNTRSKWLRRQPTFSFTSNPLWWCVEPKRWRIVAQKVWTLRVQMLCPCVNIISLCIHLQLCDAHEGVWAREEAAAQEEEDWGPSWSCMISTSCFSVHTCCRGY